MPPGRRAMPRRPMPSASTPEASAARQAAPMPRTNRDPVWSLCPWPVVVSARGTTMEVEALPAVYWLEFLLSTEPDVAALAQELMPELEDVFYDEETDFFDLDEMYQVVLDVIGTVGARPWWQVLRLTGVAAVSWDILGPKLLQYGADPSLVSLAAWLDCLVAVIFENMDPQKATMFGMQLEAVPTSLLEEDEDGLGAMETDRGAFMAMAAD